MVETIIKIVKQLKELWQNRHRCRNCYGRYAPSNHACDGCEHW